jgi:hypothetical protein
MLISKRPTKRKQWNTILIAISETKRRNKNSRKSMRLIKLSEMQAKKRTMTNSVPQNEIHSVEWVVIHIVEDAVELAVPIMEDSRIYSRNSVG